MNALILIASPRRDGNSARLASAAAEGLWASGHAAERVHLDDHISDFLRDCRTCRGPDGACRIGDGFERLLLDRLVPSDGLIFATPIYWYGVSAQLKAMFDRLFCYVSAGYPGADAVRSGLTDKRVGLLISSEETFPSASLGMVHQIQEYCRYTRSTFVDVVRGHGNSRGDVERDPAKPIDRAKALGRGFFETHASDYTIDVPRDPRMWAALAQAHPIPPT